eukprot:Gb_35559 [translate_table: standard]
MVMPLGPGRFYGSSLPRPRIYTDVKFNSERIDPPTSVSAPFLSWANDAHWSMGGLSFKRKRMQGKIEGNVKKLRAEKEKDAKDKKKKKENKQREDNFALKGDSSPEHPTTDAKDKKEKKKKKEEKKQREANVALKGDSSPESPTTEGDSSPVRPTTDVKDKEKKKKEKKQREGNVAVKGDSSPESPTTEGNSNAEGFKMARLVVQSPTDSSPMEGRAISQKWADEDCPTFVPETNEKSTRKYSPRVRIRVRKLGDVFNQQASSPKRVPKDDEGTRSVVANTKGSSYGVFEGDEFTKVPSARRVALRSKGNEDENAAEVEPASKKRKLGQQIGVFDWVPVPEKIIKASSRRVSPRSKEKEASNAAGINPVVLGESEGSARRSSRLSSPPVAGSKSSKRVSGSR